MTYGPLPGMARGIRPYANPKTMGRDSEHKGVILYDGSCGLCSGVAGFILRRDRKGTLLHIDMHAPEGLSLRERHGLGSLPADTFIFLEGGKAHLRSTGALRVLRHMGRPWRWLTVLSILPESVRDGIYDLIARNRHRWFGGRRACAAGMCETE